MTGPEVQEGTIVVYTDIACAWSTVTLLRVRGELGLDDDVAIDLRLFLLEDVNAFPIPKRFLDVEILRPC